MKERDEEDECSTERIRARMRGIEPRLTPDERYYVVGDQQLPRVSTILDHHPKPGIARWHKKVGFEEAARISEEATTFGKRVHALTERIDRGEVFTPEPDLVAYAETWKLFVADHVAEWIAIEVFLYSLKHGYAGTADRVARLKNGHTAIVDLKTSKHASDDYGLQTAAYYGALYEMEGTRVQERMAVFLPSNRPDYYGIDHFEDLHDDWAEFIRRRDGWRRQQKKEKYWMKPLHFVKRPTEEAA